MGCPTLLPLLGCCPSLTLGKSLLGFPYYPLYQKEQDSLVTIFVLFMPISSLCHRPLWLPINLGHVRNKEKIQGIQGGDILQLLSSLSSPLTLYLQGPIMTAEWFPRYIAVIREKEEEKLNLCHLAFEYKVLQSAFVNKVLSENNHAHTHPLSMSMSIQCVCFIVFVI